MKKLISIIFILVALIVLATFEEIYINNFLNTLTQKAESVSTIIESNQDNLEKKEIKDSFDSLFNFWKSSKNTLSYFTNYEKIKSLDESFVKLNTAIENNDKSLAIENVAMIKEYGTIFKFVMGFNINNLF